jgi:hypothetical protein
MAMLKGHGPLAFADFERMMKESIVSAYGLTARQLLPKPPRFRKNREVSARRAVKLRKRGEYCHFVRWTVNGKCIYCWGGPTPQIYTQRLGPWQSPRYVTPPVAIYGFETRYEIDGKVES